MRICQSHLLSPAVSDLLAAAGRVPAHPGLSFPYLLIRKIGISIPLRQSLINTCKRLQSSKEKDHKRQSVQKDFPAVLGRTSTQRSPTWGGWVTSVSPGANTLQLQTEKLPCAGGCPGYAIKRPPPGIGVRPHRPVLPPRQTQVERPTSGREASATRGDRAGHTFAGRDCSRATKPPSPGNFTWAAGTRPAPRGRRRQGLPGRRRGKDAEGRPGRIGGASRARR